MAGSNVVGALFVSMFVVFFLSWAFSEMMEPSMYDIVYDSEMREPSMQELVYDESYEEETYKQSQEDRLYEQMQEDMYDDMKRDMVYDSMYDYDYGPDPCEPELDCGPKVNPYTGDLEQDCEYIFPCGKTGDVKKSKDTNEIECEVNTYDCGDFSTFEEAVKVFITCGSSDVHHLDGDDDGIPCETLQATNTDSIVCDINFYNCDDFSTRSEMLEVFEGCGGFENDIHYLDGDDDGIPCEALY